MDGREVDCSATLSDGVTPECIFDNGCYVQDQTNKHPLDVIPADANTLGESLAPCYDAAASTCLGDQSTTCL